MTPKLKKRKPILILRKVRFEFESTEAEAQTYQVFPFNVGLCVGDEVTITYKLKSVQTSVEDIKSTTNTKRKKSDDTRKNKMYTLHLNK